MSNELEHSYIDFRHTIRKVKADQVLFSRYENFKAENLLFKNRDEKLEDVAKNFARFFIQGKNKKLEKKLL